MCVRVCSLGVETGEVRVYREGEKTGGRIRTEEDYLDAMSVFQGARQEEASNLRTIYALFGASPASRVLPSVSVTFKIGRKTDLQILLLRAQTLALRRKRAQEGSLSKSLKRKSRQ